MLSPNDSITQVPLVGPAYAKKLKRLNIPTVFDLLHHYPFRYLDRSQITPINLLQPQQEATIKAYVIDFKNIYSKSGKQIQKALVTDQTGTLEITWFNQAYLKSAIKTQQQYYFSGKTNLFRNQITLASPEHEPVNPQKANLHTQGLVPVYHETQGVSSKWLRSRIKLALDQTTITETLPQEILQSNHLVSLSQALHHIHFPPNQQKLDLAKTRLSFDELLRLQVKGAIKRQSWRQKQTHCLIQPPQKQIQSFISQLPFKLTQAQNNTLSTIIKDLNKPTPMNRLLEGDVGSGKTIVAAIAALATHLSGYKTLVMAPTSILATQHYHNLKNIFSNYNIDISLHTSSSKAKHLTDISIGTHSLLFRSQKQTQVGLVVIDEQHRFGVKQRAQLENIGQNPHRLSLSATPIPRTIALTLYGDLDVSIIDQMPDNRLPVKTWVVPETKRYSAYSWIQDHLQQGQQTFVICPLIDPSESLQLSEVKSATQEYEHIKKHFSQYSVGLLHGKLSQSQKDQVLSDFSQHKYDILVSTPVIEVGIDIPNASIILIEAAQRFGLAQLHQLRGRVGRGGQQAYCLLFTSSPDQASSTRLQSMTNINSGFKLAQIDLKIRGPGEVFGTNQHGFDSLKLANLSQKKLLDQTKNTAQLLLNNPHYSKHILPNYTDSSSNPSPNITNN